MRIACPCCGTRDHGEFSYGGDATVQSPSIEDTSVEKWFEYVYQRSNPRGPHREYWQHTRGCRSWLVVERDTLTHKITESWLAGADAKELADSSSKESL